MSDQTDTDIRSIRLSILDLLKSLFMGEPDQEKCDLWKKVTSALADEQISPGMDSAVRGLDEFLKRMNPEELQEEYYELFVNPFSPNLAHTTLSYFVDGHDFGQSLVELRSFLLEAGIARVAELEESEDSLVFLLDILSTLIKDEETEPDTARDRQAVLLKQFLDPLTVHFHSALKENEKAKFYEACAAFLTGYVDLEKGLMVYI